VQNRFNTNLWRQGFGIPKNITAAAQLNDLTDQVISIECLQGLVPYLVENCECLARAIDGLEQEDGAWNVSELSTVDGQDQCRDSVPVGVSAYRLEIY